MVKLSGTGFKILLILKKIHIFSNFSRCDLVFSGCAAVLEVIPAIGEIDICYKFWSDKWTDVWMGGRAASAKIWLRPKNLGFFITAIFHLSVTTHLWNLKICFWIWEILVKIITCLLVNNIFMSYLKSIIATWARVQEKLVASRARG